MSKIEREETKEENEKETTKKWGAKISDRAELHFLFFCFCFGLESRSRKIMLSFVFRRSAVAANSAPLRLACNYYSTTGEFARRERAAEEQSARQHDAKVLENLATKLREKQIDEETVRFLFVFVSIFWF